MVDHSDLKHSKGVFCYLERLYCSNKFWSCGSKPGTQLRLLLHLHDKGIARALRNISCFNIVYVQQKSN